MTIRAQLREEDYVAAQRLHRPRSRRWAFVVLAVAVMLILIAVQSFRNDRSFAGVLAMGMLFGGTVGGLIGYFIWVPWRARRVFRQQQTLHDPFDLSWDADGIHVRNDRGEYRYSWSDFTRYREGEGLFVINLSDAMFIMVPKRAFSEEHLLADFRELVRHHVAS